MIHKAVLVFTLLVAASSFLQAQERTWKEAPIWYWLSDHVTDERGAAIILEAFKRKVAGELELLDVVVKT